MNVVPWHALPDARECEIAVLQHLVYKGGDVVASAANPVPLQTFLSWLPPRAPKTHGAAKQSSASADLQRILSQHPGLTKLLTKRSDPGPSTSTPDEDVANSVGQTDNEQADAKAEVDEADDVFTELERQRQLWVGPDLTQPEELKVKL